MIISAAQTAATINAYCERKGWGDRITAKDRKSVV